MKVYLMDGYTICTDEVIEGAQAEWELTPLQTELINAGGSVVFNAGVLTVKPAPAVTETVAKIGLTKLEFMQRFTDTELATLYSVAKTNAAVEVWLAKFNATTPDEKGCSVYLNDPRTIESIQMLESAGLIASGRASEILS